MDYLSSGGSSFLISDCRKTDDERKKKKSIKCYVIFSVIILIPSLPLYLLAGNERLLSCAPNLRCITNNDSGCDAVHGTCQIWHADCVGLFPDTTHCFHSLLQTSPDVPSKEEG